MSARIFQINSSKGGVPKLPMRSAEINSLGITVDDQKHTKVHGGPERALCLFGLDVMQALQEEGHPIYGGSIGENILISGLDWKTINLGDKMRLGDVEVELTSFANPCNQIAESFSDKDSKRVKADLHPGWSRIYCRILKEGRITVGDEVSLL